MGVITGFYGPKAAAIDRDRNSTGTGTGTKLPGRSRDRDKRMMKFNILNILMNLMHKIIQIEQYEWDK